MAGYAPMGRVRGRLEDILIEAQIGAADADPRRQQESFREIVKLARKAMQVLAATLEGGGGSGPLLAGA